MKNSILGRSLGRLLESSSMENNYFIRSILSILQYSYLVIIHIQDPLPNRSNEKCWVVTIVNVYGCTVSAQALTLLQRLFKRWGWCQRCWPQYKQSELGRPKTKPRKRKSRMISNLLSAWYYSGRANVTKAEFQIQTQHNVTVI